MTESTREFYERSAAQWASTRNNPLSWSPEIHRFASYVPRGGRVLDAGCGHSRDAILLQELGFRYTGSDLSFAQLSGGHQMNPDLSLVQGDLNHLPFHDNSFNGLWVCAVL